MYPMLIEPSASEPYYTMCVWHVQECKCTQVRCTPLSEPSTTHPYYTLWVWHVDTYIWTKVQCTPSLIKPSATESYYTMFIWHVNECICNQITCTHPLLIKPSDSGPFCSMSVLHVEACRHTQMGCIPPNQTQWFRTLLHHDHLTSESMQTYPNEMCPPLIEPSTSEPYYTISIWHVEAWRHTQMGCIPL